MMVLPEGVWSPHILDNIYIRFGTKLYRQIVGIVPVLFLFAMKEIVWCLFLRIRTLKLLKLSIQRLDIWMTW